MVNTYNIIEIMKLTVQPGQNKIVAALRQLPSSRFDHVANLAIKTSEKHRLPYPQCCGHEAGRHNAARTGGWQHITCNSTSSARKS